ncbi:hypothetical protein [Caulobacter sp. S45]|uniref:hypothetical protein n=1 Tax=Caulobacter sp. S45 TaxID=1641861 RepID=UPI00131EB7ED|nr:hypothetical protein [Caulobacter sp. S45]
MRRLTMALAAMAALAMGSAPLAAHAADAKKAEITKDQRDKGMKAAPAVAKAAGLSCNVSDAYFIGSSKDKQDIYEVACSEGLGYILLAQGTTVKAYDCLATKSQPTLTCKLPGNANAAAGLKPIVAQAGMTCTPKDARYVGANATTTVYEVACQEGSGFILQTPAPGAAAAATVAEPCAATMGQGNMECTLTSKDQVMAYINGLVAKSGHQCQVSGTHYIGADKTSGDAYYEVGCGSQAGFVLDTDKTGAYKNVISCAQAAGLGGCTLTDTTKVATEEVATYTKLAKSGGYNCDVTKYRPIGMTDAKDEVVELACSNRPDGTVAVFPSAGDGKARFVDCVRAGQFGPNGACKLTDLAPIYAKYSAGLAAKGRSSCKVSGARFLGSTKAGTDYIETACSDGNPGWVLEMTQSDSVQTLLSCGQAAGAGLPCQLPTNMKK